MSQLFETGFRCGDGEALVTYVYGESSPAEREAIAAHIALCANCADELAALGSTRVQLTAWTPPERALGFQIPRTESVVSEAPAAPSVATVLRPAAWWNRPMPAWAQMAAAVAIFAAGMAIGTARMAPPGATVASTGPAAAETVASTAIPTSAVTREDLTQIEQRLRGEIAQLRTSAPEAAGDSRAVMQRVTQMIAASEARQQQELDFRTSVLATDLANARRIDNANFEQRLRGTDVRVLSNQRTLNSITNSLATPVGYNPASSPYVP